MQFGACVQESDNIVVDSCCFRALSFRYIVWSCFKQWCFAAVSNTGRLYVWGNAPLTMFPGLRIVRMCTYPKQKGF